jgi:hypothetical protein
MRATIRSGEALTNSMPSSSAKGNGRVVSRASVSILCSSAVMICRDDRC